jgi:hypothetical protein
VLDFKIVKELVLGRSRDELARVAAYLLAPALVMGLAVAGVYSPGLGLDFSKPVSFTELMTEVSSQGKVTKKKGFALVLEPMASDYQIPVTTASSMWISLDADVLRANADRLVLTETAFKGRSPLLGVRDPVTVIVQGEPRSEILVPGGTEHIVDWRMQSRRSLSLLSSTLLACVFAFGMALASGLPSAKTQEQTAAEIGAEPYEQ